MKTVWEHRNEFLMVIFFGENMSKWEKTEEEGNFNPSWEDPFW